MSQIKLVIKNWKKYQHRTDYKRPYWFSFSNQFWKAEKYSDMTHEQKWAWICVLSHASEQASDGKIVFNDDWLCRMGNVSKDALYSCLEILIKSDTLEAEFEIRTDSVQISDRNVGVTINNKQRTKNNIQIINKESIVSDATRLSTPKKPVSSSKLIGEYVKAYHRRYNARPVIDGRTQGLVKKILTTVPENQAVDMVQAFVQMNDPWFIKKAHDFPTFYENMTKVSMALQTGQDHGAPEKKKTWQELLAEDERKLPDGH